MTLKYRPFAPRVLEGIAATKLAKWTKFLSKDQMRLDVEEVLEDEGFRIIYLLNLPGEIEAYCSTSNFVFVREGCLNSLQRFRFTIAEELAHTIIHLPDLESRGCSSVLDAGFNASDYAHFEEYAKYMAGSFLMPPQKFRDQFFFHEDSIHPKHTVRAVRIRQIIRRCADDFDVSTSCAGRRAEQLGLLTKEESLKLSR